MSRSSAWLCALALWALPACHEEVRFDLDATHGQGDGGDGAVDGRVDARPDVRVDARTDVRDAGDIVVPPSDVPDGMDIDVPPVVCTVDGDCDDLAYCTGTEHCLPGDPAADARGCVAGTAPCVAPSVCVESSMSCMTQCPDADGDGFTELSCGGTDCNDANSFVHPGAQDVCNTADDDCNGVTDDARFSTAGSSCDAPTRIAVGDNFTCVRTLAGHVECWGSDANGQLGCVGPDCPSVPGAPSIVTNVAAASEVSAGESHACALNGTSMFCWGSDAHGQLGDPTLDRTMDYPGGVTVMGLGTVGAIAAGSRSSCGVDESGARCWGENLDHQAGTYAGGEDQVPPYPVTSTVYSKIAIGLHFACGVRSDGVVECWGAPIGLADGSTMPRSAPGAVPVITNAVDITIGYSHACARTSTNEVYCWGSNDYDQLGSASADGSMPVLLSLSNVTAVSAGGNTTCAVVGGQVQCWGADGYGQVGNGSNDVSVATPTTVSGLASVTAIAVGSYHTCALQFDSTILCWGLNTQYQLGDGTQTNSSTPVRALAYPPTT